MARRTRGFAGRGRAGRDPRLPPGQYDTGRSCPVLTAEPTPRLDTETWTFQMEGAVRTPTTWTWSELDDGVTTYICGSSPFADAASDLVVAAGGRLEQIRIERFGPTG